MGSFRTRPCKWCRVGRGKVKSKRKTRRHAEKHMTSLRLLYLFSKTQLIHLSSTSRPSNLYLLFRYFFFPPSLFLLFFLLTLILFRSVSFCSAPLCFASFFMASTPLFLPRFPPPHFWSHFWSQFEHVWDGISNSIYLHVEIKP